MTDIRIIPLKEEYLKAAIKVVQDAFPAVPPEAAEKDIPLGLSDYPYKPDTYLAMDGEQVVGVVQLVPPFFGPDTATIAWLCVAESHRGRGIGRRIMEYAETLFGGRPATLYLTSGTDPAFYEGFGYSRGPDNHYGHPVMVKKINRPAPKI